MKRGLDAPNAKLSAEQLRELVIMLFVSCKTPKELNGTFGLTAVAIQKLRDGSSYTDERAAILKELRGEGLVVNMDGPYDRGFRGRRGKQV